MKQATALSSATVVIAGVVAVLLSSLANLFVQVIVVSHTGREELAAMLGCAAYVLVLVLTLWLSTVVTTELSTQKPGSGLTAARTVRNDLPDATSHQDRSSEA